MGIWSTMPLLSTLAALVIIVHSAEEERGYRRDLRPRTIDTPSYEQPWRAVDSEPLIQPSTRTEAWNDSPEDIPERRRPVRKRKRRPHPYPDGEPQERYQESIQGAYQDHHESQQTPESRKRRKRPDFNYQIPNAPARPLRRRGIRRKRPTDYDGPPPESAGPGTDEDENQRTQNYNKYSQYSDSEYDAAWHDQTEKTRATSISTTDKLTNQPHALENAEYADESPYNSPIAAQKEYSLFLHNTKDEKVYMHPFYESSTFADGSFYKFKNSAVNSNSNVKGVNVHPESSSSADDDSHEIPNIHQDKKKESSERTLTRAESEPDNNAKIMNMIKKSKESGVIDPLMLKQILKKSNGTSLSEILQQHNLSLTDLLQGKNEALSALKLSASQEPKAQSHDISLEKTQLNEAESKYPTVKQKTLEQKIPDESISDEDSTETTTSMVENVTELNDSDIENQTVKPRMSTRRRFPNGIRRKLRMRPMLNSTLKAKLHRDYILIAPTTRKYSHSNRNVTKSKEWKEIVPLMADRSTDKINSDEATETTITTIDDSTDTTTSNVEISNSSYSLSSVPATSNVKDNEVENAIITTTEATTTITIEVTPPFEINNETEKPKVTPIVRPAANNSVLRRQVFNNRLKRKRLKQKSTTENPSDDLMKNFLGMANLVSASEFIERTQKPYTTKQENTEYATELEDFMTTRTPTTVGGIKSTQTASWSSTSTTINLPQTSTSTSTTEQSAKFEIEEILNDRMTKERLAKILRERNMTLSELVNHRERGSSHVHLADIFHNASKEPNPPEPFLTKSSIEPISKETYPLRAILEANTHETTTRTSSQDQKNYANIPVVMDFGNNVNENGESMGVISLFNKLTDSEITIDKTQIQKDSDGTPYVSSVVSVNATANDTNREGRVLSNENWNELLSFMNEHNISMFDEDLQGLNKGDTEKDSIENLDGDGLMILDDMHHLQNFESNIAPGSDENIEMKMFERREHLSEKPGILNKLPNNTKSVAIATASILGLAAILFLLTYIAFRWKQQRSKLRKKESFCVDQIPSPVFENRKSHKNNCSSRSISPMISNTNIYMSTLESHNGKESPDYMWNSLRKPFQ